MEIPVKWPNETETFDNKSHGVNWKEKERCLSVLDKPPPDDGRLYCPAMFDDWLCWDYTLAGTVASAPCPADFQPLLNKHEMATKMCDENGNWFINPLSNRTWTNYLRCAHLTDTHTTLYIPIAGYAVSCILLLISLVIFNAFRQLKCARVIIHQHLFVSFILTGMLWIGIYVLLMEASEIKDNSPTWCKVYHVATQYVTFCNYMWMFCEGFFLHTIVVQAFSKQKKLLIACTVIGWGLPVLPVSAYTIARVLDPDTDVKCWFEPSWTMWILSAPIVLSLLINFVLLLNILRILLSKIRAFNTAEHNQNRRAVKATLILVPLLGLQNLLTLVTPDLDESSMKIWNMASSVLVSLQGAAVALIFCFFNGEVLTVLKRRLGQWSHSYDQSFMGRPTTNSTTMAMTLEETSTTGAVFKNGNNRMSKASIRNAKSTPCQTPSDVFLKSTKK
ncbi:calcitonin gene-related peptide type 1 receptor-like isoform X2 [Biomphalaria glabrata]|uniref:Calcitonin gene-related peptide type 1 receptor-like isoform X2 n=1 Tax=Biomphalaria glabrata TaxID=6526 RepID=A0A9W3A5F2_BIOGL|nr:calcitonin gene-related peptide type 1 receptor-like isoform X2 [Biomphalaria glabrata]